MQNTEKMKENISSDLISRLTVLKTHFTKGLPDTSTAAKHRNEKKERKMGLKYSSQLISWKVVTTFISWAENYFVRKNKSGPNSMTHLATAKCEQDLIVCVCVCVCASKGLMSLHQTLPVGVVRYPVLQFRSHGCPHVCGFPWFLVGKQVNWVSAHVSENINCAEDYVIIINLSTKVIERYLSALF